MAGGLQACLSVDLLQREDAQTGAEALLGVGTIDHDRLGERGGGRPDLLGERRDTRRCPGCVAPMRARHVIDHGDVATLAERFGAASDALALVERLDGAFGDAHIDEFRGSTGEAPSTSTGRSRHDSRGPPGSASRWRTSGVQTTKMLPSCQLGWTLTLQPAALSLGSRLRHARASRRRAS